MYQPYMGTTKEEPAKKIVSGSIPWKKDRNNGNKSLEGLKTIKKKNKGTHKTNIHPENQEQTKKEKVGSNTSLIEKKFKHSPPLEN